MKILTTGLKSGPNEIDIGEAATILELETPERRFTGPVRLVGTVEQIGDEYIVDGAVVAHLEMDCARCLGLVVMELELPMRMIYQEVEHPEREQEVFDEGFMLIPIQCPELPLAEAVRDTVLVELPLQPLCREDCRGLCPHCGIDRNRETCDCGPDSVPSVHQRVSLDDLAPRRK